ncbi:MAG: DUF892 family protein [Acetobacterales bacterium]
MTTPEAHLLDWLRDAHAMEQQAETMLKTQASRIENYGALKSEIEKHIEETKVQSERLEECLRLIDGTPSAIKDSAGSTMAVAQGMSGMFASDEVVKGTLASYAFEHMEIASYRVLIAAARAAGEERIRELCEESLHEEEAMAGWLAGHMDEVTDAFIARSAAPEASAKR